MASESHQQAAESYDVVVVGAGFAGMYLLHRLRGLGMTARVYEAGSGVGGTWYWNRYPGARCDVRSIDYSYSFDPELEQEWEWSEKYATQPEILRYAEHVADRYDLRRDIRFDTRVDRAVWDEEARRWTVTTAGGDEVTCRFYVMASGCLSVPKAPDIEGVERFAGPVHHTSRWPHHGVDFTGRRVAVVGTGSSGIQSIPVLAAQAARLTVFQRTPNFSLPAHNGLIPPAEVAGVKSRYPEYREEARWSRVGMPRPVPDRSALSVPDDERRARYEAGWQAGELGSLLGAFDDLLTDADANETAAEFVRDKIRSIVDDPATAEALCPSDHPIGTKRPCLDTDYYRTYNLPHVRLVDLRATPITTITETGIETTDESFDVDDIVFATGFDAMTGAVVAVDIRGVDGLELAAKWADGPRTYLGLTVAGFPNLFTVTGPGSPSVLSNMMVSIEHHVDWICDLVVHMRDRGHTTVEASTEAEKAWVEHVNEVGDQTLYPRADSWYMGANVAGKPRVFLPYVGGVGTYREVCDDVVADGYRGFELAP